MTFLQIAAPWLQTFAYSVVVVVTPLAFARGAIFLKAHNVDTTLYEAIGRAGGVAFNALVASGRPLTDRAAIAAAAQAGGSYLMERVPSALAAKGITDPATAGALAGAELGKLLALNAKTADT